MIVTLPNYVFVDDTSIIRQNTPNTVRSTMEVGPQKTRPIQSIPMVNYQMTISIPSKKSGDFDDWFINDLNWGSNFFLMKDPLDGIERRFRFADTELQFSKSGTLLKAPIILETYHGL